MATHTITHAGTVSSGQYNYAGSGATLVNAGTAGNLTTGDQQGVYITGANNTLINFGSIFGGGFIPGTYEYGAAMVVYGAAATGNVIINQIGGVIQTGGSDATGIDLINSGGTVINAGLISGTGGSSQSGNGIQIAGAGGSITNASTGTIAGGGIYGLDGSVVINNAGTILGNSKYGGINLDNVAADYPSVHQMITNQAGGIISGNGAAYGIRVQRAATTVINAGTITGGGSNPAIELAPGYYNDSDDTTFHFANRVVDDPNAVFIGTVDGGSTANATLELGSGTASVSTLTGFGTQFTSFGSLTFDPTSDWYVPVAPSNITSTTINGFNVGDTIDLTGFVATNTGTLAGGTSLTLNGTGGPQTLHFGSTVEDFIVTTSGGNTEIITICFCRDTQIGTPDGEVPVQTLKAGDMVLTAHNGPRKVTWVGTGKVLATRGQRGIATPVIVRRGALGDNLPHRDLHVTKAHSLYIDDVLIPVEFLVNHRTILWDDHAQEVDIYHVELESHDILIANGVPAESYRDDGNRWLFQNANEGWHLPPQEPYAPVLTGGPIVDAVWRRLLDHAGPRDLPPVTDDPDLHLLIDGIRVDAQEQHPSLYVFRLHCRPASVVLASRDAVPAELGTVRDPRSLGVALRRLAIRQGGRVMQVHADDERLTAGFHDYEPADNLRWTNGRAELPIEAFARFDKDAEVMLYLGGATQYPDDQEDAGQVAA